MVLPEFNTIEELIHYASENYDPVKAHEYYIRNRQLMGRHSLKGFTERQREGFSYAKDQIRQTTQNKIKTAKETEKQSIEKARSEAKAVRENIASQLKSFVESLNQQHTVNSQTIAANALQKKKEIDDKLASDLAAIPEVPKNLPRAQRNRLLADRMAKIQALRGQANVDKVALNTEIAKAKADEQASVKTARQTNSENAAAIKMQVAQQLHQVVAQYAEQYKASKIQITSESGATLDKEYANIKAKVR